MDDPRGNSTILMDIKESLMTCEWDIRGTVILIETSNGLNGQNFDMDGI